VENIKDIIKTVQSDIDKNYYQKFKIEFNLIPDDRANHNLKIMKETCFKESLKGKHVLDIGCSHGFFSMIAEQLGATVLAIDVNKKSINIANRIKELMNLNNIEYRLRSFDIDLVKEKQFDLIICMSVYHYMFHTIKDHDKIFKLLYDMGGDLFFEDALDMDDVSCNEFFSSVMPELKSLYTSENILDAAKKYYEIRYMGTHINETRHIYWMKRKNPEFNQKYVVLRSLYENEKTQSKIEKIEWEDDRKFYVKKTITPHAKLSIEILKNSYLVNYNELINLNVYEKIPELLKIYNIEIIENNQFEIFKEYLGGYTPIPLINLSYEKRQIVFLKIIDILYRLWSLGYFIVDFGPWNFMINNQLDIKLIDIDYLVKTEEYDRIFKNYNLEYCYYFVLYFMNMLHWLNGENI